MANETENWIVSVSGDGRERGFAAEALPVHIGGTLGDDLRLEGVSGSFQLGVLDGTFFIQPSRDTRGLRVDGELVSGSRRIEDGEVIALDTARLRCALSDGRLSLDVNVQVTGGDTAPPDLEELARDSGDVDDVEIAPIAFRPKVDEQVDRRGARPSKAAVAVSCGFVLLAVMGWFAFTAKSVQLVFDPQPQTVSLPDTLFKLRLADRYLLRSGTHRVTAELPGYYPLDTEFEVGLSPDQSIELQLARLPGLVSLSTEPDVGAEVYVDGELLGRTPLVDAEIMHGLRRLELTAERYLSEVRELDVIGGGERQNLSVMLTPNWAPVTLVTEPPGAQVLVDGIAVGTSPTVMELTAGERRIEARLRGFNAWADTILVNADEPRTLPPITLTPADGRVELVSNPADAAVSVDGEYRGRTPLTVRLPPGRAHRIMLTKPGYDPVTRELSVEADSGRRLELSLTAQLGEVEVTSEPAGAVVWVDGERQGETPVRLTLMAVAHQLEVRYPGFASQSLEVTPRPGFPQILDFVLEELDVTTGSGYAKRVGTSLGQELVLVLPGQFTMGSSRREQGRRSNESLRTVELTAGFYLGVREVTNAEFRAFDPEHDSGAFSGVSLNDDEQPVARVTWEESVQFLNWLSIRDGFQPVYEERAGTWVLVRPVRNGYRLPTEAEWAWAARFAGGQAPLRFAWGAELPPPDRSGNYADVSASQLLRPTLVTYNDSFAVAAPVGSFDPNPLGIFDLGGNVAEWVQDYYEIQISEPSQVVEDPLGPEQGRQHVVRGPSWKSATITNLRLAYRDYSVNAREDLGFRIARNLE